MQDETLYHAIIKLTKEGLGQRKIADELMCSRWKVRKAQEEFLSEIGENNPRFDGDPDVSTLYNAKGTVVSRWVKYKGKEGAKDPTKVVDYAIEALKNIPERELIAAPQYCDDDLLNLYVITDYHFGMLAWQGEGGADWDLKIAEETLLKWITSAIARSPDAHTAILGQLGDFLHFDSMLAVTPTHGHVLDAAGRYPQIVQAAVRIFQTIINLLLEKHQHVHIKMCEGNHDMASSVWLRVIFNELYKDNDRVSVDMTNIPYYAYEWGDVALFFHHGHKRTPKNLSETFVSYYRALHGRTKFAVGHTGHQHHKEKENGLVLIEQHQTLSARDAHCSYGGYASQRSASVITYHKTRGEVERSTIIPEV